MTIRKWFYLFWTTLAWGIGTAFVTGLILVASVKDFRFLEVTEPGLNGTTVLFTILGGAVISMLSQMGFFSYQIIRFIALGILRNRRLWDGLQLALVVVTFVDMVYLSYTSFGGNNDSWTPYLVTPAALFVIALAISIWKVRLTNSAAFGSTLFFMFSVTILEAVPALKLNGLLSNIFMFVPLIVCNAWQILILPRVLDGKKELAGSSSQ